MSSSVSRSGRVVLLNPGPVNVSERVRQIRDYHQLNQYERGAVIMQRLRKLLKLTGNFDNLDLLTSAVSW